MAYFNGEALETHYEKDFKDFKPKDWTVLSIFGVIVLFAIILGFSGLWGMMTIFVGIAVIMIHVILRVIIGAKNKLMLIFDALGFFTIIGGIICLTEQYNLLIYFGFSLAGLAWLFVGFICTKVYITRTRKIKEYTLRVQAVCEVADVRRINLFRFDDIHSSYLNPMNANALMKPCFHYWINGAEYYTDSVVYYGNGNTGFREGSQVELLVNPKDYSDILPKDQDMLGMFLIMGVFGWIFGILWGVAVVVMYSMSVF